MPIATWKHVTPAGAGLKNGDNWANAYDWAAFHAYWVVSAGPGIAVAIMEGNYAPAADLTWGAAGTQLSPSVMFGVKAGTVNEGANIIYADWALDAADRPFIDFGAFNLISPKVRNDSAIARIAMLGSNHIRFFSCEAISDNGTAMQTGTGGKALFCLISSPNNTGLLVGGDYTTYAFNNITPCLRGVSKGNRDSGLFLNNTTYLCDIGYYATVGYSNSFLNNILEGCITDGILNTVQTDSNFYNKNWGNDARNNDMWDGINTTEVPFMDNNNAGGDPMLTNPGVDHSLQDGSPCEGNGMSIELGVG